MSEISFDCTDVEFTLKNKQKVRHWLNETAQTENHQIEAIAFIFCSDTYLLEMNRQFLDHDYYTDILTFDHSEGETITADIFISVDRVKDNASTFNQSFHNELHRVMVHGLLHLCGYADKSGSEQTLMRQKEDSYLSLL